MAYFQRDSLKYSGQTEEARKRKEEIWGAQPKEYDQNNEHAQSMTDLQKQYQNRGPFTYDATADALYNQYKDRYINLGKLAMQDTMGQAAAMTGGYGNSYAAQAGNQSYQQYLTGLTDKIPELYSLAYQKYQDDSSKILQDYNLAKDLDTRERELAQQDFSNWATRLGLASDEYSTSAAQDISLWEKEQQGLYDAERDAIADAQAQLALAKSYSSGSGSSSYKSPTAEMYDTAESIWNDAGSQEAAESALKKYLEKFPDYDVEAVQNWIYQYGTTYKPRKQNYDMTIEKRNNKGTVYGFQQTAGYRH